MNVPPSDLKKRIVAPGARFQQVFPPSRKVIEVERWMDEVYVAIVRTNGARQAFPYSTLTDERYWVPLASDDEQQR